MSVGALPSLRVLLSLLCAGAALSLSCSDARAPGALGEPQEGPASIPLGPVVTVEGDPVERPGVSFEAPLGPDGWSEAKGNLALAVVGSAVKVRPHVEVKGATAARLLAARNEFESFQVVVHAEDAPIEKLRAKLAGPLKGKEGAELSTDQVTLYRVGYYEVVTPSDSEGAPGRWPDPLIPAVDPWFGETRNAFPLDIPKGENRALWVDVLVPPDAAPGRYRGALELTAEHGRWATVPVELEVLGFTLPSTTTLKSAFGLHGGTCEALGLTGCHDPELRAKTKSLFVRAALDNRISIAFAHSRRLLPGDGSAVDEFRRHTLPFLRGTAPTRLEGARLTTYQVNMHKDRMLEVWKTLAPAEGFADRAFVYACDEPHFFPVYGDDENNWKLCEQELLAANASWPEAPKLVTAHIQSAAKAGMTHLFDIMVLNVELLHGPAGTEWHEGDQRPLYDAFLADPTRKKELWLYTACGTHGCTRNDDPYTVGWAGYDIDVPATQARAMPWMAFLYRISGTLYFETGMALGSAWDDQYLFTGNGDGTLFYPGTPARIGGKTPIPVESMRLKLIRDGYEDYEYLKRLEDVGEGAFAHQVGRQLFSAPFDTSRTDEDVQAARRALAKRLVERLGSSPP